MSMDRDCQHAKPTVLTCWVQIQKHPHLVRGGGALPEGLALRLFLRRIRGVGATAGSAFSCDDIQHIASHIWRQSSHRARCACRSRTSSGFSRSSRYRDIRSPCSQHCIADHLLSFQCAAARRGFQLVLGQHLLRDHGARCSRDLMALSVVPVALAISSYAGRSPSNACRRAQRSLGRRLRPRWECPTCGSTGCRWEPCRCPPGERRRSGHHAGPAQPTTLLGPCFSSPITCYTYCSLKGCEGLLLRYWP